VLLQLWPIWCSKSSSATCPTCSYIYKTYKTIFFFVLSARLKPRRCPCCRIAHIWPLLVGKDRRERTQECVEISRPAESCRQKSAPPSLIASFACCFNLENSIAPSGWRCSNGVLCYCTVRPLGALWRLVVGGTISILRLNLPSPFLTAGCTLTLSDGWVYPHPFWRLGVPSPYLTAWCTTVPPFRNRQATRGAVTAGTLYGWVLFTLPFSDV
jgi:hypothetical protein